MKLAKSPQSLRLHFETRRTAVPFMYIFAQPMEEEQINRIQTQSHRRERGFSRKSSSSSSNANSEESKKDSIMLGEVEGFRSLENALKQAASPSSIGIKNQHQDDSTREAEPEELCGLKLTVRNRINGEDVERPSSLTREDVWEVAYIAEEMEDAEARRMYRSCRKRKKAALSSDTDPEMNSFFKILKEYSLKGKEWREEQDATDHGTPKMLFQPIQKP
jgi:hypothetical protein